jgi:hypothetical protein
LALNLVLSGDLFAVDASGNLTLANYSSQVAANVASTALDATSSGAQTNDGSVAEVTLTLPPALPSARTFEFCVIAAQVFNILCAGSDKIMRGQWYPYGASHMQSAEPNAVLKLRCFKAGFWHVAAEPMGKWSGS